MNGNAVASSSRLSLDSTTSTVAHPRTAAPHRNGAGSASPSDQAHRNSIHAVLVDPSTATSLLPSFSLAENPYIPSSISSLSTAFSSGGGPKASGSNKAVAQRRSRAPPLVFPELRKVDAADFDAYLAQIGPEWDRWQKERKLGSGGNPGTLGEARPRTEPESAAGLALSSDQRDRERTQSHQQEENLPPLDGVPQIFFDPNFNLSNPHTFDLVTERLRLGPTDSPILVPSTPDPNDPSSEPIPGLGSLTLADLAADQILQEKLSHYTAVIESHLVREIGIRSASFFSALSNLQHLHQQGEDCLAKIAELQSALAPSVPGVGRSAKDGLQILRAQARRRALEKIDAGVRAVEDVWSAVGGVEELVQAGEWVGALQVAEHVEALYYGSSSASPTATATTIDPKVVLTKVQALNSIPRRLAGLRGSIAKSLEAELVAVLEHETQRAVSEYVDGKWTRGSPGGEEDMVLERAKDRARPVVGGLVRAEGMDAAVAAWREAVLRHVRSMVRVHLPSSETASVEDEDAFANISSRQSIDLSTVSEKSTVLAKKLGAMSHAEFLALAERTYTGLLGTLAVVDIHARVLLSLATEAREAEAQRKAQRLNPAPVTSTPSTPSRLTVPGASPELPTALNLPSLPTPALSSSTPSTATLEADVSDVVHAAAELANLRFSKVIGVRTDAHGHLPLDDFVAIFDASWTFVVQCEIICQRMIVGLRGVMVGQAKTFLQTFHQKRLTEGARLVEEEQWAAVDVKEETQNVVDLVLEAAVNDPTNLLLGRRLQERLASGAASAVQNGMGDTGEDRAKTATAKQLRIEDREYFAVSAGLAAVDVLADYLKVVVNCPLLTTDAMSKIVEFLKSFNSRTCQVVLGAGAMRSAGLKNITAKHLALASQALSIMISLIPYIRETLRRHLAPKQAVMLVEFDKLKRDYHEHQNEIHSKLVAIMSDRLQVHCKTLEGIDWEQPIANRDPASPNVYMEALIKEHVTLHKVLSRFMQASTVEFIMGQVFSALNARLAEEYGKIELKSDEARSRMLVDVAYLKTKLAELKGLERDTPGVELEHLVESKQLPLPARLSMSERPSPRTSISERPSPRTSTSERPTFLQKSASTTSLNSTIPEPPSALEQNGQAISIPSSPIVESPLSPVVPTPSSPSLPPPAPPSAPIRRKSMAERLAELARRKPSTSYQEHQKSDLPSVPQGVEPTEEKLFPITETAVPDQSAQTVEDPSPATPIKGITQPLPEIIVAAPVEAITSSTRAEQAAENVPLASISSTDIVVESPITAGEGWESASPAPVEPFVEPPTLPVMEPLPSNGATLPPEVAETLEKEGPSPSMKAVPVSSKTTLVPLQALLVDESSEQPEDDIPEARSSSPVSVDSPEMAVEVIVEHDLSTQVEHSSITATSDMPEVKVTPATQEQLGPDELDKAAAEEGAEGELLDVDDGASLLASTSQEEIRPLEEPLEAQVDALLEASSDIEEEEMSYNPNANSFQPGGGAPPFQPGQPYQPQGGAPPPGSNPYAQQQPGGDYYNQYAQQSYGQQAYGGYQQQAYGGYGGGYQQPAYGGAYQQPGQGYGGYQAPPAEREQVAYVPPVRSQAAAPSVPFSRSEADASAPAPAKPPTMSLKIGGSGKPATVSLSIGGSKKKEEEKKEDTKSSASGSKPATPAGSKPGTPAPSENKEAKSSATASSAASASPAATASTPAAAKKEAKAVEKEEAKSADALLAEVKAVADAETLQDLFGNDEALKDMKPHLNIVFIGHVDAGKSTMGGNLLYLCGMVDKRTLEKYEREAKEAGRESWYLSWALDSTSQEREKGKTVEIGRAYFETEKRRYTILDAPGHKNFVPSMISGAAQADIAVLVISARKGEFETGFEKGGQTREHAMLVKTAGVNKIIVVVNKMDDPTVNWDKARYDEIHGKLSPFLKGTGFNLKTDVTFIPVSGFTGANLKEPVDRKIAPWVEGDSLLNFLDSLSLLDRKNNAPLMMPISEKYGDMGTVVVGKVESGTIRKGQNLLLMPNKTPVTVGGINNEMEEEVPAALCGDNVRVRLRGVEDEDISPGFVLTSAEQPVKAVTQFEAQLVILDHKNIICAGYSAVMHVHTAAEEVTLSALLHYYDKKTGKKSRKPPQFAKKGQKVIALIETAAPVCVERFVDHPQLGRFTLRDEGRTIGIGKVVKLIDQVSESADLLAKIALE